VDPDGKSPESALLLIAHNRKAIHNASQKYQVSSQAIASIIFQEKYHGYFAEIKNFIAYSIDLGIDDNTPLKRSYGIGEMSIGLAGKLMGINPNKKGSKNKIYNAITKNNSFAIELIAKNIALTQKILKRKLNAKESAILHNAGIKGLRSYLKGDKLKGGVYDRSLNWQKSIKKALDGWIDINADNPYYAPNETPYQIKK